MERPNSVLGIRDNSPSCSVTKEFLYLGHRKKSYDKRNLECFTARLPYIGVSFGK
jgi:hypothetical protein